MTGASEEAGPGATPGSALSTGRSRLPRWVRLSYGAGQGGATIMERLVFIWLYFFWVQRAAEDGGPLIAPLDLGLLVFGGRVIDAVTDPLVARWSDGYRGRLGRRRPLMLWSGVPYVVVAAVLFFPPVAGPSWVNTVYLGIGLVVFYVLFTLYVVPCTGLLADLSPAMDRSPNAIRQGQPGGRGAPELGEPLVELIPALAGDDERRTADRDPGGDVALAARDRGVERRVEVAELHLQPRRGVVEAEHPLGVRQELPRQTHPRPRGMTRHGEYQTRESDASRSLRSNASRHTGAGLRYVERSSRVLLFVRVDPSWLREMRGTWTDAHYGPAPPAEVRCLAPPSMTPRGRGSLSLRRVRSPEGCHPP